MRLASSASHHDAKHTCIKVSPYFEMANNLQPDDFHVGWICAVQMEYVVPLQYHPSQVEMTTKLIACGCKFCSLLGTYHRQYRGVAFYMHKGRAIQIPVNSRIMVDPRIFRELHPGYSRPRIYEQSRDSSIDLFVLEGRFGDSADQVKLDGMDPHEMQDRDLLICSPTLPGWILSDKTWGEIPDSRFSEYS